MTPLLFAYWLQGFFEQRDALGIECDPTKIWYDCVQAHINLVKATMKEHPGNYNSELVAFLGWMESAIELEASFPKITTKLNGLFEHVIDPMTPDEKQKMSQAHQSHGGWFSPEPEMKC